jgi:hypothetical protein
MSWDIPEVAGGGLFAFEGFELCIRWLVFPTVNLFGVRINPLNIISLMAAAFVFSLFYRST